jgi:1-phosphofructokinase
MSAGVTSSPHIFTLTGNLLAERTWEFAGWTPGRTQRARHETFQVGGKGINVSKMLMRLGAANTALCFGGGTTGDECETWLRARGFLFRAFRTAASTRTGIVARDTMGVQGETTLLGPDAAPDPTALQACAEFLDAQPAGQALALCGSFPGWEQPGFDVLRAALERWLARGLLVADTYGAPLAWAAERPCALVKINADELRLLGGPAFAFDRSPVRRWVVTDGAARVWVRDELGVEQTRVPPPVTEVSATGSGDVLLACVLHAWLNRRLSLIDALAFALPYAAANAAHPGIAEFPEPSITTDPKSLV